MGGATGSGGGICNEASLTPANSTISGNSANHGGDGDDQLRGGEGDDRLVGGPGVALLDGGDGRDVGQEGEVLIGIPSPPAHPPGRARPRRAAGILGGLGPTDRTDDGADPRAASAAAPETRTCTNVSRRGGA
jgi:Ca2+-binding RTX toxin-like protein